MNVDKLLDPRTIIPCLAIVGLVAFSLFIWLYKTESRQKVRRVLEMAMTYVFLLLALASILLFAFKYIPMPIVNRERVLRPSIESRCRYENIGTDREFYRECFSDLLTVFGVFGTLFGVIIPFAGYLLQRRSLRDEAEQMRQIFEIQSNNQQALKHEISNMRKKLDAAKTAYESLCMRRESVIRSQLDGIRASMECQLSIYRIPALPADQKGYVVRGYLLQFVDFLRLIAYVPTAKPFSSDIGRFRDAIKVFRRDYTIYQDVLKELNGIMTTSSLGPLSGLRLALAESEYEDIVRELGTAVPSLFDE